MHELSLATSIVETVTETLAEHPGARVKEVRLRVGVLASVIPESLEFCWGIVTEATPLDSSRLVVDVLSVVVHCAACAQDSELDGVQSFRCPRCGQPCSEMSQGRELEIESIDIEDEEDKQ